MLQEGAHTHTPSTHDQVLLLVDSVAHTSMINACAMRKVRSVCLYETHSKLSMFVPTAVCAATGHHMHACSTHNQQQLQVLPKQPQPQLTATAEGRLSAKHTRFMGACSDCCDCAHMLS